MNASLAKRNARNHNLLALVANSYTNPSYSRASSSYYHSSLPYYVTHPPYMHDYDDDYKGEIQGVQGGYLGIRKLMLLIVLLKRMWKLMRMLKGILEPHLLRGRKTEQMLLAAKDEAYGDNELEDLNTSVIMLARIQPTDIEYDVGPTYYAEVITEQNTS
nr:hypothetical protein [Tanacetum cinerariifolium]